MELDWRTLNRPKALSWRWGGDRKDLGSGNSYVLDILIYIIAGILKRKAIWIFQKVL